MRSSDWSSDVCSSDLGPAEAHDADRVVAQDGDQVAGKARDGELREADHAAVAGQHHERQRDGAEDQRIGADLEGEEVGGEAGVGQEEDAGQPGGGVDLRERASAEEEGAAVPRSEEHTSELQSILRSSYAVFCLKQKTQ